MSGLATNWRCTASSPLCALKYTVGATEPSTPHPSNNKPPRPQSAHPAAVLHGMARAVSGGAVYVSDKPGQHDFELLRRLVLPDGTVLRGALPGRPTRDSLFCDPLRDGTSLLKVRGCFVRVTRGADIPRCATRECCHALAYSFTPWL